MFEGLLLVSIGVLAGTAAFIDWRTRILPNSFNFAIATLSVIWACYSQLSIEFETLWTWLLIVFIHLVLVVLPPYGLGGGDLKLIAALGITASVQSFAVNWLLLSYCFACFSALIVKIRGKDRTLAFGPWLVIAWIVAFMGQ